MAQLPTPCIQVGFATGLSLPDCLRAALQTARGLRVGVLFTHGDDSRELVVWPWTTLEDALAQHDPEHAASVQAHVEAHRA